MGKYKRNGTKILITPDDTDSKGMNDLDSDYATDPDFESLVIPKAKMRKNNSMQIGVEQMEKYMQQMEETLGSKKKDFTEFTDNIESNLTVLPELKAVFEEKNERATEFYGDMTKKQSKMESEMSSMKQLLISM